MLDYKHLVQTVQIITPICRQARCPKLDFSGWIKAIEWSVITVTVVCHAGKLMTTFSLSMRSGFHIVNTYCNRKDSLLYFKPPPGWQTSIDHSHPNWDNLCLPVFYWETECRLEERLLSTLLSSNDILLCSQNDNTWNKRSPITVEVQDLFWTWKMCCLFTLFSCLCLFALRHAM